jgi:hypothetical protein
MSIVTVPTKSTILTDYDFAVDKTRLTSSEPHDCSVTIRMPGKNRKTANHELVFIPYFKKYRVKFKTVAIGKNKKKKQTPIVVFDQHTLGQESATIRKYEKIGGIVNSKGHALKILEIFKIAVPAEADEVIKVYFRLHPTLVNRTKKNYRICVISLMKVIKNDRIREPRRPPNNKKRQIKTSAASKSAKADVKEKPPVPNIL